MMTDKKKEHAASSDMRKALEKIIKMETPYANATVKRMALCAWEVLDRHGLRFNKQEVLKQLYVRKD